MQLLKQQNDTQFNKTVSSTYIFQSKLQKMNKGVAAFIDQFPNQKYMNALTFLMKTYVWASITLITIMLFILLIVRKMRKTLIKQEICLEQDSQKAKAMWKKIRRLVNWQA